MEINELVQLRRLAYGMLGAMLLHPEKATLTEIAEVAGQLRTEFTWDAELAFSVPWDEFVTAVEELTLADMPRLQSEYSGLFDAGAFPQPIPLMESAYLNPTSFAAGQLMADLDGEYTGAGLAMVATGAETPDHAGVELEFISYLCELESDALESGDMPAILDSVQRQERFLRQHPCRWLPSLARAVESRGRSDFYARATRAAHALTSHDVDFVEMWSRHLTDHVSEEEAG
jgi:TorA maturation chaperone TorD